MVHIDKRLVGLCGESYVVQYTSQHTKSANITDRISKISFSLHLQVVVVNWKITASNSESMYTGWVAMVFLQLLRIRAFLHSFSFSMLPATGMLIVLSKNKSHWKKLGLQVFTPRNLGLQPCSHHTRLVSTILQEQLSLVSRPSQHAGIAGAS